MRDSNIFGQCLVDSDPVSNRRTRDRRRKALLIALILEALALAVLLLAPLAKTEMLPTKVWIVERPPVRATQSPRAARNHPRQEQSSGTTLIRIIRDAFNQPHSIPKGVKQLTADDNSSVDDAPSIGRRIPGDSDFFGIPGGSESGPAFVVPPPLVVMPPTRPIRRSESLEAALLIHRIDPIYPVLAVQIRLEGTVQLHAIIGRDGEVRSLEVLSGHPLFLQSALDAVRQWRYRPSLLNGEAVEVETSITVIYTMHR